jgi:hypothetical protein
VLGKPACALLEEGPEPPVQKPAGARDPGRERRPPLDRGAFSCALEIDLRAVVADGRSRERHVAEASAGDELDDLVASGRSLLAEDANGADALRWRIARPFELEGLDRRPEGPAGPVREESEHYLWGRL